MMKKYLGIDISDDSIRYVYLNTKGFNHVITKAGKSKIDFDILTPGALRTAIKELIKLEKLKPSRIFVTVSRKDTVIHQFMLPKLSAKEFEEVITTEIEKIPTFHKQAYDYIYRKYPVSRDKFKVILSAVRRDILDRILKEVHKTGIPFRHIEITPLNFKELPNAIDSADDCDAFVVVSDRQTYLSIYDQYQHKLFYKLASGLNQFQHTVSQEQIRLIVLDWAAQLKRVFKSFLLDNRNIKVRKIWLVWDKEVAPNLDQYMGDEFDIPVEILDVRKIKKIKTIENYPLNPIYSLALAPIVCHIHQLKLQFSLRHFFGRFQLPSYAIKSGILAALIVGIFGVSFTMGNGWINAQKNDFLTKSRVAENKTMTLRKEAATLYVEHAEYDQIRQQFLAQATYVQELNRVSWAQVFAVVANELPLDLALTSFKFSENGSAKIKGEALNMESISEMLRRIEESAILDKGKFDFLKEKQIKENKLFNFGILAMLKKKEQPVDDKTKN